jgi:hypothetical protein
MKTGLLVAATLMLPTTTDSNLHEHEYLISEIKSTNTFMVFKVESTHDISCKKIIKKVGDSNIVYLHDANVLIVSCYQESRKSVHILVSLERYT